jgi:hypothetical protein
MSAIDKVDDADVLEPEPSHEAEESWLAEQVRLVILEDGFAD